MVCRYEVGHHHDDNPKTSVDAVAYGGEDLIEIRAHHTVLSLSVEQFTFLVEHAEHLIGFARKPQRLAVVDSIDELAELLRGNTPSKPKGSH